MAVSEDFKEFVFDQLTELGEFETKNMFGGVALLHNGSAFGKIKHDKLWLKVDDTNKADFENQGMVQYTYGKDNSRKLNFFETPVDILENRDELIKWTKKSIEVISK